MPTMNTLGDLKKASQELIAVCHDKGCRHRWLVDLDYVIEFVGVRHTLVPVRGKTHFSERMKCLKCGKVGVFVWMNEAKAPEPLFGGKHSYVVSSWYSDGHLHNTIAAVSHLSVAWAAYHAAVPQYPRHRVMLQQGAFTLADSRFGVVDGGKIARI